jgi:hypothetical protein
MDDQNTPRIYSKDIGDAVGTPLDIPLKDELGDPKEDGVGQHHFVIPEGEQSDGLLDISNPAVR